MSNHIKSIIFAAGLSIVCGSLLTLASTGLKEYHLKNIALDKQKNILKSVGLIQEDKELSTNSIEELYTNSIRQMWVDFEGKIVPKQKKDTKDLPVYLHVKNGNIQSYIIHRAWGERSKRDGFRKILPAKKFWMIGEILFPSPLQKGE